MTTVSPSPYDAGSTSSGTESSDTESDAGSNSYSQPLVFGNPGAANSSPMPQSKFSCGSLQLEDGVKGETMATVIPSMKRWGAILQLLEKVKCAWLFVDCTSILQLGGPVKVLKGGVV